MSHTMRMGWLSYCRCFGQSHLLLFSVSGFTFCLEPPGIPKSFFIIAGRIHISISLSFRTQNQRSPADLSFLRPYMPRLCPSLTSFSLTALRICMLLPLSSPKTFLLLPSAATSLFSLLQTQPGGVCSHSIREEQLSDYRLHIGLVLRDSDPWNPCLRGFWSITYKILIQHFTELRRLKP